MNTRSFRAADAVRLLLAAALLPLLAGCLSIHKVADKGNLTAVKQYLKAGVAVDARDRQGRTPLMYMLTDRDAVRYLVEQGADVNARDAHGDTLLLKEAVSGRLNIVQYLLKVGATVDAGAPAAAP